MLTHLRVQNLAIIDELEVELGPGLNVVTGETGAGKSILVTALQLVLGARGRPDLVRAGADRAEVEALFDLRNDPAARARLRALDLEEDELVVRRVVEAEGRSRAYVDGRLATNTQLEALAAGLVDISSQHEHHSLVNPASHLTHLDAFAGLEGECDALAGVWEELRAATAAVADLHERASNDRAGFLRFQLDELDRAGAGADDEAAAARLRHATALSEVTGRAEDRLYADDGSITAALARVEQDLAQAARLDPALTAILEQVAAARTELEDAGQGLGRYRRALEPDPARLAALEERLHDVRRLRRKHGDDLDAARARLRGELHELEESADRLQELEARLGDARARAATMADTLSARRRDEAGRLAAGITAELASLGMGEARVEVQVDPAGLGARGIDRVELLIATNRGEEPRPLRRVASGGELSRALLAIKRVLAARGPVGLYVFDEVDTGVGGAIADQIGLKLAEVARHHQVLCITHLAPIAARGDAHFHVQKRVEGERTRSSIVRLRTGDRVDEIARMLGRLSDTTRAAARELLGI